jgi:hypothetical protein
MENIFKLIVKSNIIFAIVILYSKVFKNNTNNKISNFFFNFCLNNKINIFCNKVKYLSIFDIIYLFSFKYNIVKIEYKFGLYENSNKIIEPSEFLSNNINFICSIQIIYNNITINSLPNIYENKYFTCVEFFKINEKINFGIKLYEIKENSKEFIKNAYDNTIYFFNEKIVNYNEYIFTNNKIFDPNILIEKYIYIIKKMHDYRFNNTLKLKQSYIRFPYCLLKRFSSTRENIWIYENIYDNYFCFCKGFNCLSLKISQKSKYFFNLYIIDNNRNVYKKTDYLFVDFIFSELSSDDAFPIFKEMFYQNFPVHYLTENIDIFNEFCTNKNKCISIIYVNKNNYTINGEFIEKHLTLFLKLKQVITGGGKHFYFINNLFYNIEYITLISITHGVCFFKYFLYEDYNCYGHKSIDKLLVPPSQKIISLVKKHGWKEENLIKLNLPKWDKYTILCFFFDYNYLLLENENYFNYLYYLYYLMLVEKHLST